MFETGIPHLKKLVMIKFHLVAFIQHDPGVSYKGFRVGPSLNPDHPCSDAGFLELL
jgi:hypothetical protein